MEGKTEEFHSRVAYIEKHLMKSRGILSNSSIQAMANLIGHLLSLEPTQRTPAYLLERHKWLSKVPGNPAELLESPPESINGGERYEHGDDGFSNEEEDSDDDLRCDPNVCAYVPDNSITEENFRNRPYVPPKRK